MQWHCKTHDLYLKNKRRNSERLFLVFKKRPIESCQKWKESLSQQIDLGFNLFFMVYFFIRFVAAEDKFWFWLDIYSIVDFFTIPPSFVSIYLDRHWIGTLLIFPWALKIKRKSSLRFFVPRSSISARASSHEPPRHSSILERSTHQ